MEEILINWIRKNPAFAEDSDDSYHNRKQMMEFAKHYHKNQLLLHNVSQQRELLFCGGCGNKKQLIVETDINSQRVCKNKLCKQNNCG